MATLSEIDSAVAALRDDGCEHFVLLKCTSAYPSDEGDADLATLPDMIRRYGCDVGLSDHTLRPYVAFAATALGAAVIEKHCTLSRAAGGVDAAFSLEPAELRELVHGVERIWTSLGVVSYGPRAVEETSLRERPSIYVVRPVRRGERFTVQNVRIIRPASGLPPAALGDVLGARSSREIVEPMPLSWDLVERDAG
jgi:N-acetylneuraminate synthase